MHLVQHAISHSQSESCKVLQLKTASTNSVAGDYLKQALTRGLAEPLQLWLCVHVYNHAKATVHLDLSICTLQLAG